MVFAKLRRVQRRGAVAVEAALVMLPMTMLLGGIITYAVLLMDWNLLNNAAREGCRYALANNTDTSINTNVQGIVTKCMAGRNASSSFSNFTVTVSGTHLGVATPVNNLGPGDQITVTVSGKYAFLQIIPLISMRSITLSSSVTMTCEGGT